LIGWSIGEAERAAITTLPATAWTPALAADGGVREKAEVAELTGLLTLAGWPQDMRVIVRRERPHPGAQLSLFEHRDGRRYTAFVTNTAVGALQWLEARHRAHARVEDRICCAKDTGLRRPPSREFAINQAWCTAAAIAADLVAWLQLHALDGDLAAAEPKRLRSRFNVSRASAEYVRTMWEGIGTIVMGRHLFDLVNGWEGHPPAGDHVVVVSHRPKPDGWHPEASYHFVDDVATAVDKARELAGQRDVAVNAGEVGSQILAAGLVDQVAMDVVPVVFGSGKCYFGSIDGRYLLEDPHVVIHGDRVLHLRFNVRR
jgi:dihydrofolate reductase